MDLLITNTYPPYKGGVAKYLYELSCEISEHRDITVITRVSGKNEKLRNLNILRAVGYNKIPIINKIHHFFLCVNYFIRNKNRIENVLAGSTIPFGVLAILLKTMKPELKIFVFTYGSEIIKVDTLLYRKLLKYVLGKCDFIITISNFTKNALRKYSPKPIIMVYPGYNGNFYKKNHTNNKKILLLTIASLTKRKGQQYVIDALSQIDKSIDFEYHIIGNGHQECKLKELACEKGIGNSVFIHTGLSDEEVVEYYKKSDIFIMTTYQDGYDIEGFGIVYLEAGAYSLPVIATDVGGVGDVVKNNYNGIIVKTKNIESIIDAIVKLYKNSDLRNKLGQNGIENAKIFNYSSSVKELLKYLF